MELVVLLCAVSLLHSCEAQERSAVTPLFVKKGEDVLLNVTIADDTTNDTVTWKFNKTDNLVRFIPGIGPKVSNDYSGRIEVLENYSVKLKNLQEADSGVYTVVVSGDKEKQITACKITVQDPVSPVNLTVDSVSNRSDWCNLTVSCRAQDSHINSTFRCLNHTCSQEGGERSQVTPSAADLHVYLSNHSIICKHSNQVSWSEDIKVIKHFCLRLAESEPTTNVTALMIGVIGIVLICISIIAAVQYFRKREKNETESRENTVYEVPQVRPLPQSGREVIGLSPTSTYCLVGPHTGSVDSSTTRGMTLPESLYAQVNKPAGSLNK
ncbi:uncharacterized protein LOC114565926 isoform X2 [Perca flavescens]|uniref:uncharacterized protein LOC114565926 isoform X2 n=1 Tax=Perca flavescens TaxID=8167 RepID=UPI00106DD7C1|nr:uncharacterized protein LOC114565926 isoform X2 [Perca flavescens]